jgi:nucleotide-binding universal stress UspA family protein
MRRAVLDTPPLGGMHMFRTILVPLDGSTFAEQALPVAHALAETCDARLALVRVVAVIAPGEHEPGVVSYLDEHRIAVAQEYIHQAAVRIGTRQPVTAEAYVAADVASGILMRARDIDADVIVMTAHGASWPEGGDLGSVATRLIRESPCPVLVIGPRGSTRRPGTAPASPIETKAT